ncbi:NAD(P)/FAD-dependent oxidoreductase [Microbacterium testaceum]|uniref:NAD(P)/FAD-dependent oxidoreductase n=1 Tax=Microbacterium testaceum TaxID=2033 RepID=UPI0022E4BF51|nr:FAD-dependent oxidoreductase [Microbacterium testaceum]
MSFPRDAGRVVIVGAGLAGFSAAQTLRSLGHEAPVTLVDAEPTAYDRPPLSKRLFANDFSLEDLAFSSPEKLSQAGIETRFGQAVEAIDAASVTVTLENGEVVEGDTLLLAIGGRARSLTVSGADLPGVRTLRTFDDAAAIRAHVRSGTRVAVIGAGLIGAELASALHLHGADVTLIDPAETPLQPVVGSLLASHLHAMHSLRGIRVVTGLTERIETDGEAMTVVVDDGSVIPAELVVVGVGLVPNIELAAAAGLETDGGILVDEHYRTSVPSVFAAGDVARLRDSRGVLHRREEHWEAAQLSGQHAAHAMLGMDLPVRGASWFWSDRHGIHLEASGRLHGDGEFVVRPGVHPAVFLVDEGLLVGVAAVDDNNTVRAARRIIDQRIPVVASDLADPSFVLRSLLRAERAKTRNA